MIVEENIIAEVYGSWLKMYTDGSRTQAGSGGAAVVCDEMGVCRGTHFKECESSTEAELVAIVDALRLVLRKAERNVVILTDFMAAIQSLQSVGPSVSNYHLVERGLTFLTKIHGKKPGLTVIFQWVPAHVGISGNERADAVAKCAAERRSISGGTLNEIETPLGTHEIKRRIKKMVNQKWQREWTRDYSATHRYIIDPRPQIGKSLRLSESRKIATAIHRIRCGVALTGAYLRKMDVGVSGVCEECGRRDNIGHLLLSCVKYESKRKTFRETAGGGCA